MSNELKALAKEFLEDISADFPNEKFESKGDCSKFWIETTKDITHEQYEELFNDTEKLLENILRTEVEEFLSLSEDFLANYAMSMFYFMKPSSFPFVFNKNEFEKKLEELELEFQKHLDSLFNKLSAFAEGFSDDLPEEEKEKYNKIQNQEFKLVKLKTRIMLLKISIRECALIRWGTEKDKTDIKELLLKNLVLNCYNGSNIKELAKEAEVDEETIQRIVDEIKNENV